ncbi:MAG TPA: hypothetical protein VIH14_04715 [Anaerolineales bacterium]
MSIIRLKTEAGQTIIEYVLIIVLIALFLVAIFTLLSDSIFNVVDATLAPQL